MDPPKNLRVGMFAVSTERHVQQCCSTVRKLPRPIPATRALTAAHTPPLCPRSAVRKNHPLVPQHFSQHYFSTPPPPPQLCLCVQKVCSTLTFLCTLVRPMARRLHKGVTRQN